MATFAETADSSYISKGLNKETLSWFQMWGNKPQEKGRQLLKASKQDSYRPEVNGLLSDSLSGPSLVGHVLTARNLPLFKSASPSTLCFCLWTCGGEQLSQVSHTAETLLPPLATKHGLGRNAQSQKVKYKSSSSLSALKQLNSREQNIPCSVPECGFLCKIPKEHSNEEKVWGSTVNIPSIVYIFDITWRCKQYSKFEHVVSMKHMNSVKFSKRLDKIINTYTALSGLSKVGKNYSFLATACGT